MRIVFILLLTLFTTKIWAQESTEKDPKDNIQLIQSFIHDLANDSIATDVILSQYLIVENPSDEMYDYLEVSLEEVRINLLSKKINEINYIPYAQMPRKDVSDIDIGDLDSSNMYFLQYRKRQMLAVYLANGKIASFTLVSKGNNKAHFVLY